MRNPSKMKPAIRSVAGTQPNAPFTRHASLWRYESSQTKSGVQQQAARHWAPDGYNYPVAVCYVARSASCYEVLAMDADAYDARVSPRPSELRISHFVSPVCAALTFQEAILEADLWLLQHGWTFPVFADEDAALSRLFWLRREEDLMITGSLVPSKQLAPWSRP